VLAAAVTLVAGALLPPACTRSDDSPSTSVSRPNIILITLDTLRADHLSCYGYSRPTSPILDGFAAHATRFDLARATAPWTLPSHASLFTGLYPFEHGTHNVKVDVSQPEFQTGDWRANLPKGTRPLAQHHTTLAEFLSERGYQTAAIIANYAFLDARWKLDQGFDHYDTRFRDTTVDAVNQRVFGWLSQRTEAPFFLFINYMDTHRPYNTSPRPGLISHNVPHNSRENLIALANLLFEQKNPDQTQVDHLTRVLVDQYDLAVANMDAGLGDLFSYLKASRLFDDALILITSDHGEFFGEHALVEHSRDVYEPVLSIPMFLKSPRQETGSVETRPVSLAHVPHLILSQTEWAGQGHFFTQRAHEVIIAENHYSLLSEMVRPYSARFNRVRRVVYSENWKYISSSDNMNELYDIVADPDERTNLMSSKPRIAARLSEQLRALLSAPVRPHEEVTVPSYSEEELERLRALGYY
jgi:arylsulfatase A-like enzyme